MPLQPRCRRHGRSYDALRRHLAHSPSAPACAHNPAASGCCCWSPAPSLGPAAAAARRTRPDPAAALRRATAHRPCPRQSPGFRRCPCPLPFPRAVYSLARQAFNRASEGRHERCVGADKCSPARVTGGAPAAAGRRMVALARPCGGSAPPPPMKPSSAASRAVPPSRATGGSPGPLDKTPLALYANALAQAALGPLELAARLPGALAGILLLPLLFVLTRAPLPQRLARPPHARPAAGRLLPHPRSRQCHPR